MTRYRKSARYNGGYLTEAVKDRLW